MKKIKNNSLQEKRSWNCPLPQLLLVLNQHFSTNPTLRPWFLLRFRMHIGSCLGWRLSQISQRCLSGSHLRERVPHRREGRSVFNGNIKHELEKIASSQCELSFIIVQIRVTFEWLRETSRNFVDMNWRYMCISVVLCNIRWFWNSSHFFKVQIADSWEMQQIFCTEAVKCP